MEEDSSHDSSKEEAFLHLTLTNSFFRYDFGAWVQMIALSF